MSRVEEQCVPSSEYMYLNNTTSKTGCLKDVLRQKHDIFTFKFHLNVSHVLIYKQLIHGF